MLTSSRLILGIFTAVLLAFGTSFVPITASAETDPAPSSPTLTVVDPPVGIGENGTGTFSVSGMTSFREKDALNNFVSYNVVMSVEDGTLSVDLSGGGTELYGYPEPDATTKIITASDVGFEGTRAEVIDALSEVTWNATDLYDFFLFSISVTQTAGENTYYWPGDGTRDSARYYKYVSDPGVTWSEAEADARSNTHQIEGLNGYLVRPSTWAENQFVANKVDAPNIWIAARRGTGVGDATKDWFWVPDTRIPTTGQPAPSENGRKFYVENWRLETSWSSDAETRWLDDRNRDSFVLANGTSFGFSEWLNADLDFVNPWWDEEPNGTGSNNEWFASTNYDGRDGRWNDFVLDPGQRDGEFIMSGYLVEYNAHEITGLDQASTTARFTISSGVFDISSPDTAVEVGNNAFTDVCTATCEVSGFGPVDQILVVVGGADGTTLSGRLRLDAVDGLTEGLSGYQDDATEEAGHPELAFVGTQAQINAALATLQYQGPLGGGNETLSISATLSGAAYFAGTGHYYEFVSGSLTWAQAKEAAERRTFNGLTGYLATITSAEENAFIVDKTGEAAAWVGGSDDFQEINLVTDEGFDDQGDSEGLWHWVTGPEAGTKFWDNNVQDPRISDGDEGFYYQNWNNSLNNASWGSEPNNSSSAEHYLQLTVGLDGNWNDLRDTQTLPYVVEYGGLEGETVLKEAFTSFVVSAPTVPASVTGLTTTSGNAQLVLSWSAPDTGGADITDYVVEQFDDDASEWIALAREESPSPTFTVTGLTNGTEYTFRVSAVNIVGTGDPSDSATGTPVAPPPPVAPRPNPSSGSQTTDEAALVQQQSALPGQLPPGRTPTPGTAPPPLAGPLPGINGNGGQPPQQPTALVGGRPTPVETSVVGQNQVTLQTGNTSFGLSVPQGQGSVGQQGAGTELAVDPGAQTRLSGSGLFPGSTVQVFMPLGANGSREIAQFPVDPSGAFDGDAVFTTGPTDPPLPIGRHVLQIASLNDAGERVIVEMTVNIAQPGPSPEFLRTNGEIPGLNPGQSLATQAGLPVDVSLNVDSENSLTTIEGDGWAFSIDVSGGDSTVEETPDGGALMRVVRDGEASISGNGFMPLSRADIWLFSDPTLLGSVQIDENGEFNGTVTVDGRVVPVGDHTLQIQGVGVDGFVVAANLGVVVSDPSDGAAVTTQEAAGSVLWWVLALIALLVLAAVVWWVLRRRTA